MRAIGIDLGTTNSAAAVDGKGILPNRDNEQLTPSVVSYIIKRSKGQGEIVIGRQAANNADRDPLNTIFSIKRLMGRVYGEQWRVYSGTMSIDEIRRHVNYRIADPPPSTDPDQGVKVLLGDKAYTPVDISALILGRIKEGAELALGEPVTHAVITVPAYFDDRQRDATTRAGEQAGLTVLKIIDEPTAAALAFGLGKEQERHRVLVYDLGGGTFDVSIVQMTRGQYTVLEMQGGNSWPVEVELAIRGAELAALAEKSDKPQKFYVGRDLRRVFRAAGLAECRHRTWTIDRQAPLGPDDRAYLSGYLEDLRKTIKPHLEPEVRDEFERLADPESDAYLLDSPDFTAAFLNHTACWVEPDPDANGSPVVSREDAAGLARTDGQPRGRSGSSRPAGPS